MTPYRTSQPDPPVPRQPGPPLDDDRAILWVALVVSLLGVVPQVIRGGAWGAQPSMALLIAAGSAFLLARGRRR